MIALSRTALSAIGYRPDEVRTFLKTFPLEHRAQVRPAPPRGPANAAPRGRNSAAAFQPTVKECLVAASVMLATAALGLWLIVAAAG